MFRPSTRSKQAAARPRRVRTRWSVAVEALEGRSLLTTFNWIGTVGGNFSDSTMWTDTQGHHGVPGPGDVANTPSLSGGSYTIKASGATTVGSFTGGAVLEVLSGGTFTVTNPATGPSTNVGSLQLDAGAAFHTAGGTTAIEGGYVSGDLDAASGTTIAFDGPTALAAGSTLTGAGTFSVAANLFVTASTTAPTHLMLTGSGTLSLVGTSSLTVPSGATLDWQGGYITGQAGSTVVKPGGALTFEGPATKNLDSPLNNYGTATWAGAGNIDISSGANFLNEPGGVFNVTNSAPITGGANGSFTNSGTLEKFANTGTSTITVPLTNNGTIKLDSQTILGATGGFTQTSSGSLNITVAGAGQFGQLQAGVGAKLGGTLGVTLGTAPGGGQFVPTVGQVFPVLAYGSATVNFSKTTIPTVNGSPAFTTSLKATEFDLVGTQIPPQAPTNLNVLPSKTSGVTASTQPQMIGNATPGSLIQVFLSTQLQTPIATATTGTNGTFTTTQMPLAVGKYTLVIAVIGPNGLHSPNTYYNLTIVPTPPKPTGLALLQGDYSPRNSGVTDLTQPQLVGQAPGAPAGTTIKIYDQKTGGLVATATTNSNGTFTTTPTTSLAVGSHTFYAVASDQYGDSGAPGATYAFSVVAPPPIPKNLLIYSPDDSGGPGITAFHQPHLTGNAPAGTPIQIYNAATGSLAGVATTGSNGIFVASLLKPLSPGSYQFYAQSYDAYGDYSSRGTTLNVTITPPPPAPKNLTINGQNPPGPGTTSNLQPEFTGTALTPVSGSSSQAKAGLLVQIYEVVGPNKQVLVASGLTLANGTFHATPKAPLSKGTFTFLAVAIDSGNNYGTNSGGYTLKLQ